MDREEMRKALSRAFNYGQTYFAQSDSESYSQNKRADKTWADYERFVEETIAAVAHSCDEKAELVEALKRARNQLDEDCFTDESKSACLENLYVTLSRHGG